MGPLSKLYNVIVNTVGYFVPKTFQPLWNSPTGPQTVFFWGPFVKWGMVMAGLGDSLGRPAQNISLNQCGSLAAASLIYTRYSMAIIPKNYFMLYVNLNVLILQSFLIAKHLKWRSDNAQNTAYKDPYFSFHWEEDW